MSRGILLGTLGVLALLLGVTKYALNKETAPPPPPTPKQVESAQTAATKQKMMHEAKIVAEREHAAEAARAKIAAKGLKKPGAAASHPANTMVLDDTWFTRGTDGQQGVAVAQKAAQQSAQPAAAPKLAPTAAPPAVPTAAK